MIPPLKAAIGTFMPERLHQHPHAARRPSARDREEHPVLLQLVHRPNRARRQHLVLRDQGAVHVREHRGDLLGRRVNTVGHLLPHIQRRTRPTSAETRWPVRSPARRPGCCRDGRRFRGVGGGLLGCCRRRWKIFTISMTQSTREPATTQRTHWPTSRSVVPNSRFMRSSSTMRNVARMDHPVHLGELVVVQQVPAEHRVSSSLQASPRKIAANENVVSAIVCATMFPSPR